VRHAADVVNDQGMGDGGYVANRVVTDTLLRAKIADTLQDNVLGNMGPPEFLQGSLPINPGSRGHPELCSRACLYFPLGKCTNGNQCAFCHAPHSKRASHLDKRHREMLRAMDFMDRLRLILPILKAKFEGLEDRQDLSDSIDTISQMIGNLTTSTKDKKKGKEARTLQAALKFVSARSLAALLYNTPAPSDCPHHQAIEELLHQLKPSLSSGLEMRPDPQCDSELYSRMSDRESDFL